MNKGAILSACGKYRYQLWRIWDDSLPLCMWVMHNPSTADADSDDPTIRRCIAFAKSWGYGGIYVGSLTPYRATNPKDLLTACTNGELWRVENIEHIKTMVGKCKMHVFAYGNPVVDELIPGFWDDYWHYLKLTKAGNPGHPLYLRADLKPMAFKYKEVNSD